MYYLTSEARTIQNDEAPLKLAANLFMLAENFNALKKGSRSGAEFQYVRMGGNLREAERNQNVAASSANAVAPISNQLCTAEFLALMGSWGTRLFKTTLDLERR